LPEGPQTGLDSLGAALRTLRNREDGKRHLLRTLRNREDGKRHLRKLREPSPEGPRTGLEPCETGRCQMAWLQPCKPSEPCETAKMPNVTKERIKKLKEPALEGPQMNLDSLGGWISCKNAARRHLWKRYETGKMNGDCIWPCVVQASLARSLLRGPRIFVPYIPYNYSINHFPNCIWGRADEVGNFRKSSKQSKAQTSGRQCDGCRAAVFVGCIGVTRRMVDKTTGKTMGSLRTMGWGDYGIRVEQDHCLGGFKLGTRRKRAITAKNTRPANTPGNGRCTLGISNKSFADFGSKKYFRLSTACYPGWLPRREAKALQVVLRSSTGISSRYFPMISLWFTINQQIRGCHPKCGHWLVGLSPMYSIQQIGWWSELTYSVNGHQVG